MLGPTTPVRTEGPGDIESPATQSVGHRPAALALPKGVLEMQSLRSHSRPPESECLREGPRNLNVNKINRNSLSTLQLGTGLENWLLTKGANQNHRGGGGRRAGVLFHYADTQAPLPGLLKQGI